MKTRQQGAIRLWTHGLEGWQAPAVAWLELLDREERAQCQRFHQAKDRLAYAAAHALLRRALSQTLGLAPAALLLARDTRGKPYLATAGASGLDFSLSHTDGMVAVALSEAGKVGVDVEAVDRKNISRQDFSAFGLSPEETAQLDAVSEPQRSEQFIELWTAREAVAKADGRGLALPLAQIRIDRAGNSASIAMEQSCATRHWRLWLEQPSCRHHLALAWPSGSGELVRMGALL